MTHSCPYPFSAMRETCRTQLVSETLSETPLIMQDVPSGCEPIQVVKAKSTSTICSTCFYVQRGSFSGVKQQELEASKKGHSTVEEKPLAQIWHTVKLSQSTNPSIVFLRFYIPGTHDGSYQKTLRASACVYVIRFSSSYNLYSP